MALKKKTTKGADRKELLDRLQSLRDQKKKIEEEELSIKQEMFDIEISPFKIGDHVMAEVSSGRRTKVQECIIEADFIGDYGQMYLRPIKADGCLSQRHFFCDPPQGKTYSDILTKC